MELAHEAEAAGWVGFFLCDHIQWTLPKPEPLVDPWMLLAGFAVTTTRIKLGPLVTPVPRRRPWKLAREAVSLDHLSNGRLVLGVGIGPLSGRALRIAHMGHVNAPMILGTLGALEVGLVALGIAHGKGGLQAAIDWLGGSLQS